MTERCQPPTVNSIRSIPLFLLDRVRGSRRELEQIQNISIKLMAVGLLPRNIKELGSLEIDQSPCGCR